MNKQMILIAIMLMSGIIQSQNIKRCGTDEYWQQRLLDNPELLQIQQEYKDNNLRQIEFHLVGTMSGAPYDSTVVHAFTIRENIGDVNNDGFPDWAISDYYGEYVYLFFGGTILDTVPDLQFYPPPNMNGSYGVSLCGGDLNGDGFNDLIVGAYSSSYGIQYAAGRVFIYYGGSPMDTVVDAIIDGQVWRGLFGAKVVSEGDVNGDGWDDLLVSALEEWETRGSVYLYLGGPSFDTIVDGHIEGEDNDGIDRALDFVGDINGDGNDEFLIGAKIGGESADWLGKAYLVFGGDSFSLDSAVTFFGDSLFYDFGRKVTGLGDVNGDLIPDFAIAADDYCYIYSGATLDSIWYMTSGHPWNSFSWISNCGDLNDDGYDDVMIKVDTVGKIYYGGPQFDTIEDLELFVWGPIGDFNQDDYAEILSPIIRNIGERCSVGLYTSSPFSYNDTAEFPFIAKDIRLYANYPNPFNSSTIISYNISNVGLVYISIYDITGRDICTLVQTIQPAGIHYTNWDGTDTDGVPVSNGIYLCRLHFVNNNQSFEQSIKLTLLK
ncbi:MAG: FG-GAP repeat protein [Candidatus Marinimicrobia bacterium]|nr:FG-GAP repeat protein [Candidatus Neomarinimicrobiota bacterium]